MTGYGEVVFMTNYRQTLPQPTDPLEHLYKLERDLEAAEQRTASLIDELTRRLEALESTVSSINSQVGDSSRQLERDILNLAQRIATLEKDRAA